MFNIDPEEKARILSERITAWNREGYEHELNLAIATAQLANATDETRPIVEGQIADAENAIQIISTAIEVAQSQLDNAE